MTLATMHPERCPDCDGLLGNEYWWEDALIRAGGYGATRHTLVSACLTCGYWHRRVVTEVAP
jgi:hypothetical protein